MFLKVLPEPFIAQYGEIIPETVAVLLRNGDVVKLQYVIDEGMLIGMSQIFERFNCSNGCMLLVDYNGGDNFSFHIVLHGVEEYAGINKFI